MSGGYPQNPQGQGYSGYGPPPPQPYSPYGAPPQPYPTPSAPSAPPQSQPYNATSSPYAASSSPYGAPSAPSAPYAPSKPQKDSNKPSPYGAPPPTAQPYGAAPPTAQPYGAAPPTAQPYGAAPYGSASPQPYGGTPQPYGATPQPYGGAPPQSYGGTPQPYGAAAAQPYGSAGQGYGGGFAPGTDPSIIACFQLADQDRSGMIDDYELQSALSSYNQSFSLRTVHLLMYNFTGSSVRRIGPKEFTALYYSLQNWRSIFERFDRDRSGKIDVGELREALLSLGFSVSPAVLDLLVSKFDKTGGKCRAIEYDNFIECCLTVKGLTEKFKEKDTAYSGSATFTYESFMLTVLPFLIA